MNGHTALWHKLLDDIPGNVLTPEQKHDARIAMELCLRTDDERAAYIRAVLREKHYPAAEVFRALISLLKNPGAKPMACMARKTFHSETAG